MTNQEAIKYLQQLYPNGGHCWLDEQRIEAISMAVKALQEEPVSEELGDYINELSKQFPEVSFAKLSRIAVRVAKWQKEQMMNGAVEVQVNNDPLVGRYINMSSSVVLDTINQLNSDKAKLIIIKED